MAKNPTPSLDEAKKLFSNALGDALSQPGGLLSLFGPLLAQARAQRPAPPPEDEATKKARIAANLAAIERDEQRAIARHRKARVARGLSPQATGGPPEPRVTFHLTPAARKAPRLPKKNPTLGDYQSAKARQQSQLLDHLPVGASRFGGVPDLPPDLPWPTLQKRKLPFLAQIDCSTLPRGTSKLLPKTGWLYAFGLFDDKRRKETPVVLTLYQGKRSTLARAALPKPAEIWPDAGGVSTYDLVPLEPRLAPPPKKDKFGDLDHSTGRHGAGWLFGNVDPAFNTAAEIADEEFRDGDDWIHLLALESVGNMQWSDSGHLYFLVRRKDLAKLDLSHPLAVIRSS